MAESIEYADAVNSRLRSQYYKFICKRKARNVVVTVIPKTMTDILCGSELLIRYNMLKGCENLNENGKKNIN